MLKIFKKSFKKVPAPEQSLNRANQILRSYSRVTTVPSSIENSNLLLNQVYNSQSKEEFLENLEHLSKMLKSVDSQTNNSVYNLSTDNHIRLGILDSQISSFLYSYGQEISPRLISDLMVSSFKLGMFQTSGFFEFVVSRTSFVSEYPLSQKVNLLEIFSHVRQKIKQRNELDFRIMVEKLYLETVLGLKKDLHEGANQTGNIELLDSLIKIEQLRKKQFREVELKWFNAELIRLVRSGQLEQECVENSEEAEKFEELKQEIFKE